MAPTCKQFQRKGHCSRSSCPYHHPTKPCCFAPHCTKADDVCTFSHFAPRGQSGGDASAGTVVAVRAPPSASSHTQSIRLDHRRGDGSRIQAHIQQLRTTLVFVVSLDVSGSMHGSRLTKAVACLGNIYHKVMRSHDLYSCHLFHNNVERLHGPMPKARVDWAKDKDNILKHGGGGTALYDAIIQGVRDIKDFDFKDEGPDHKYVVEHLVITDGEDNSSRSNVGSAEHCVQHSRVGDYHLNIISIGIEVEHEAAMQRVTSSRHAHYYPVRNVAQFEQRMKEVAKQIRARLRITDSKGQVEKYQFEGGQREARAAAGLLGIDAIEGMVRGMFLGQ